MVSSVGCPSAFYCIITLQKSSVKTSLSTLIAVPATKWAVNPQESKAVHSQSLRLSRFSYVTLLASYIIIEIHIIRWSMCWFVDVESDRLGHSGTAWDSVSHRYAKPVSDLSCQSLLCHTIYCFVSFWPRVYLDLITFIAPKTPRVSLYADEHIPNSPSADFSSPSVFFLSLFT